MFNGPVGIAQAQHGQAGQGVFLDNLWIIIVATAATVIAILVAYRLLFPSLTKVKASQEKAPLVPEEKKLENPVQTPKAEDQAMLDEAKEAEEEAVDKARVEAALQVLGGDERKVIQELIDHGGRMLQREISWETGFSRVKTHRVLVRLLNRGLVSAEKYYNTNRITLVDWLGKAAPVTKPAADDGASRGEEDSLTVAEEDKQTVRDLDEN
jgi:predicted DNA-binding transcriptional regulator